jgi:carbamoyl-phosphate synthase large subunit
LRGLETESIGFDPHVDPAAPDAREQVAQLLATPGPERIWIVGDAFRVGMTVDDVFNITKIDRWYLVQIEDLIRAEQQLVDSTFSSLTRDSLYALKRKGFSDARLAQLLGVKEADVRGKREELNADL